MTSPIQMNISVQEEINFQSTPLTKAEAFDLLDQTGQQMLALWKKEAMLKEKLS